MKFNITLTCHKCGENDLTMVIVDEDIYCWLCFCKTISHILTDKYKLSLELEQ